MSHDMGFASKRNLERGRIFSSDGQSNTVLLYAPIFVSCNPETIESWSSHLDRIARPFLILLFLATANATIRGSLILDYPLAKFGSGLGFLLLIHTVYLAAIFRPTRWLLTESL